MSLKFSFNAQEIKYGGATYVFVTRTNAKPLTSEEIAEYLDTIVLSNIPPEHPDNKFTITKDRHKLFFNDLKEGMAFCTKKYMVSKEEIEREAKRIFPSLKIELIERKKNGQAGATETSK
jgi:hypothetical protein